MPYHAVAKNSFDTDDVEPFATSVHNDVVCSESASRSHDKASPGICDLKAFYGQVGPLLKQEPCRQFASASGANTRSEVHLTVLIVLAVQSCELRAAHADNLDRFGVNTNAAQAISTYVQNASKRWVHMETSSSALQTWIEYYCVARVSPSNCFVNASEWVAPHSGFVILAPKNIGPDVPGTNKLVLDTKAPFR